MVLKKIEYRIWGYTLWISKNLIMKFLVLLWLCWIHILLKGNPMDICLTPIGRIRSPLKTLEACPLQGREGAPEARVEVDASFRPALDRIRPGMNLVLLTWFHKADRSVLKVHPRHNPENPLTGVFLTRSPNRPNPVGLHEVRVVSADKQGLVVEPLEALDNTPVLDIKIYLPHNL